MRSRDEFLEELFGEYSGSCGKRCIFLHKALVQVQRVYFEGKR
jgi:hypothetical protein